MMLPYLLLAAGAYLLYDELKKGKKDEKTDRDRSSRADRRRQRRDDPKPNRDRIKKEEKNVEQDEPDVVGDEPVNTDGSQQDPTSPQDREGGVNDETIEQPICQASADNGGGDSCVE